MNWKSYKREIQVAVACSISLVLSLSLLYLESKSRGSSGKEIMGTVSFRYKTAQRKFPDRMLWEDLDQGMAVHDKDSIRTDEASEAIVYLNSGTQIELDPQSMVVLQLKENKENLELGEGSLLVINGKKALSVLTGSVGLNPKLDSVFRTTKSKDGVRAEVQKGEIEWTEEGIVKSTLVAGESALEGKPFKNELNLISPEDSRRYFPVGKDETVEFSWNDSDNASDFWWEVSTQRDFSAIRHKKRVKGKSIKERFSEGIFFWRIRTFDGKSISQIHKFRILPNPPPSLHYPAPGSKHDERTVSFAWSRLKIASGYRLQISTDPNFANWRESQVFRTNLSLTLDPGTYYWRVVSYANLPGTDSASEQRMLIVNAQAPTISEKEEQISSGQATEESKVAENTKVTEATNSLILEYPKNNTIVDMTGKDSLVFRWKSDLPEAKSEWKFRLYLQKGGGNELVYERKVKGKKFGFRDLEKLDIGKFVWSLELEGNSQINSQAEFKILLREELEAPETKSSGARP
ncbi:iron dicitrate transport regulator FecR [Leptospira perolatii]|uniref:Iron dicitrate transport regulator FecR n=1 Tax=Leptospira perolatii TaxID=2023191 RepID=A0A2M9ZIW2_9LEPT|nr:FecR domain-containing protein [Leptospira perolatii]PJZ68458.1 iron dicitrate transport regulator FecR [Leptospira perolatii]PJZ71914.1 iron dicitrate transport regulator FecR [Leptospira perolatii]